MRHKVVPSRGGLLCWALALPSLTPVRGLSMPAPTPLPLRQAVARRHQRGQTARAIAQALGLPPRTVRLLLQRRRQHGDTALRPAYGRCGRRRTEAAQELRAQAVAPAAVQAELRQVFARWGRPATFRVDNGGPWGSAGDLPPDLALWLLGLGIDLHWNDARAPEQNGIVERSQGTGKRGAEPWQCATVAELQQRLQEMDAVQREDYPSIAGRSRAAAFPGLAHSGRRYTPTWERRHWDHRRVLEHLAGYAVPRRVNKNGEVSLYHRSHYVGCMHRGKEIYVMVDPERVEWLFVDSQGLQLRSQPADELQAQRIRQLTVTKRG